MHRLRNAALLTAGVAFILASGALAGGGQKSAPKPQQSKPPDNSSKPDNKPAPATPPPQDKINVHGGTTKVEAEHAFEVVFMKTGIHVYAYDMKGEPLSSDGLSGTATFTPKKPGDKPVDTPFKAVPGKDGARAYLAADAADMTAVSTVKIAIKGLKGDKEKSVSFDMPFSSLSPEVHYVCPKCQASMADPGECPKDKVKLDKKTGAAAKS